MGNDGHWALLFRSAPGETTKKRRCTDGRNRKIFGGGRELRRFGNFDS